MGEYGMATIAGTATATTTARRSLAPASATASSGSDKGASEKTVASAGPSVVVDLSSRAKTFAASLLSKATSPAEDLLKERKDALAGKLADVLKRSGIPAEESLSLTVDKTGAVKADSPYKKTIEQYFKDDPDAAKALKQIAELSAMVATQKALEAKANEQAAAKDDDDRTKADERFLQRSATIQNLSGRVTFEGGKITTGADDFVTALTPATTPDEAAARASAVDRLKTTI